MWNQVFENLASETRGNMQGGPTDTQTDDRQTERQLGFSDREADFT